jgi:hypothetical protein
MKEALLVLMLVAVVLVANSGIAHAAPLPTYWANLNLTYRMTPLDVCAGTGDKYHSLIAATHDAVEAWMRWFPQLHMTEVTTSDENITITCSFFQSLSNGHIAEAVSTFDGARITHAEIRLTYGAISGAGLDLTGGRLTVAHEIGHTLGFGDEQVPGLMGVGVMRVEDTIRQIRMGDDASYLIIDPSPEDMAVLNETYRDGFAIPEFQTPILLALVLVVAVAVLRIEKRNRS